MAETEKTDKQQPPSLLFVVVEKKEKQQAAAAVRLVSNWTLFNAAVAFAAAYTLSVTTTSDPCSCSRRRRDDDVLAVGYVGCSVLQAAAAALALMVASQRRRRALAYVALALAQASHCILAGFVAALLVDGVPGQLSLKVGSMVAVVTFAVGDVLCLLALWPQLLRGGSASWT